MKSILQTEKECYICGSPYVEEHHIFYGTSNRKNSERTGLKVYLCPYHHRGQGGVHHAGNKSLDLELKRIAQRKFEETHTREEFMRIFGQNYIDE